LGVVAVLPFLAGNVLNANAFSVLGSGLLIVVGVVKDTFFGLETELKLRGYDDTMLVR
jgi:preprotein translocase subunit SecY